MTRRDARRAHQPAAVAAWTDAGREVAHVLATRGEAGVDTLEPEKCGPLREREQRAGAAVVGVTAVEFLDHADGVIEYGTALCRDIAAAIRRHRPELVITLNHRDTWGGVAWNSPDHVAVGRATLDAAGDAGNRWISHAVDATAGLDRAVRSLLEHRTSIEVLTGERFGGRPAVAFELFPRG
ncbi:PIG-L deacetylase family protein [Streptomyces sp. NPDC056628]|uniref:PIG-L deacetylase family protein n=1 Tax=Streptomyces sp. NPDC056628 TaxID=3345882 RepID=UPI00368FD3DC